MGKITTNGTFVRIAGNGTANFGGNGGEAKNAVLSYPASIIVGPEPERFIYFADSFYSRIRRFRLV